jgi:hypothetical protein
MVLQRGEGMPNCELGETAVLQEEDLAYDLYTHRGWINRTTEKVVYAGDGQWRHSITVDINLGYLYELYYHSGRGNSGYVNVPLNEISPQILNDFSVTDGEGKTLSLQHEEERLFWQFNILDTYARRCVGQSDGIQPEQLRDCFKEMMASLRGPLFFDIVAEEDTYHQGNTVIPPINWEKAMDYFGVDDIAVAKDDAAGEDDKQSRASILESTRNTYDVLMRNNGFAALLKRFVKGFIPLIKIRLPEEFVFSSDDAASNAAGFSVIIKYEYSEQSYWLKSLDDEENVFEGGDGLPDDDDCFDIRFQLDNPFSSEREYICLEAPKGTEFLPVKEGGLFDVYVEPSFTTRPKPRALLRLTFENLLIKTRRITKKVDIPDNPEWFPSRVPGEGEVARQVFARFRLYPKIKTLLVPFVLFVAFSMVSWISALSASLTASQNAWDVLRWIVMLIPLVQFFSTEETPANYLQRVLLRKHRRIMTFILALDLVLIAYLLLSPFLPDSGSILFFGITVGVIETTLVIGIGFAILVALTVWLVWYRRIIKKRTAFEKDIANFRNERKIEII